jgi:hypothetical protein
VQHVEDTPIAIPPERPREDARFEIYRPGTQVYDAAVIGDLAVVAAGAGGIHTVRLTPQLECTRTYDTDGFAVALARAPDDVICVAECEGGLSLWETTDGALKALGRYQPGGRLERGVTIPGGGRYAFVRLGMSVLDIVDLTDPTAPVLVSRTKDKGFLYHVAEDLLAGRHAVVLWQLGGLWAYDVSATPAAGTPTAIHRERIGMSGAAVVGEQVWVPHRGRLRVFEQSSNGWAKTGEHDIAGGLVMGSASMHGDRLYLASRPTGDIQVLDISDSTAPESIECLNIPGNPGRIITTDDALIIANGYEGLWVERD